MRVESQCFVVCNTCDVFNIDKTESPFCTVHKAAVEMDKTRKETEKQIENIQHASVYKVNDWARKKESEWVRVRRGLEWKSNDTGSLWFRRNFRYEKRTIKNQILENHTDYPHCLYLSNQECIYTANCLLLFFLIHNITRVRARRFF